MISRQGTCCKLLPTADVFTDVGFVPRVGALVDLKTLQHILCADSGGTSYLTTDGGQGEGLEPKTNIT